MCVGVCVVCVCVCKCVYVCVYVCVCVCVCVRVGGWERERERERERIGLTVRDVAIYTHFYTMRKRNYSKNLGHEIAGKDISANSGSHCIIQVKPPTHLADGDSSSCLSLLMTLVKKPSSSCCSVMERYALRASRRGSW